MGSRGAKWMFWGLGLATTAVLLRQGVRQGRRFEFGGRVVVITGGSRGLGLALARGFAAEGARLALIARDGNELERAAAELRGHGAEVLTIVADVTHRPAVRAAIRDVLVQYGRVDVLVNNAGIMDAGPVETMTYATFREHMRLHAWAPLYAIRAVLDPMRQQGGGRIVNIVSFGGRVAVPHMAPYTMSKFALAGLSDGMRSELARHGIRVTSVYPGLMRTGSHVQVRFHGRPEREHAWFAAGAGNRLLSAKAETAARRIIEACRFGQATLVITPWAKALIAAQGVAPNLVAAGIDLAARLMPRPAPLGLNEERLGHDIDAHPAVRFLSRPADDEIGTHNQERAALAPSRPKAPNNRERRAGE